MTLLYMKQTVALKRGLFDMANVSHEYKNIFFHIPKTGGVSVGTLPFIVYQGHHRWNLKKLFGPPFKNYFKWCIVRNPWDRFVSVYFYFKQMGPGHRWYKGRNLETATEIKKFRTFRDFCIGFQGCKFVDVDLHIKPQLYWITTPKGKIFVDFIGKMENMGDDINKVAHKVNFTGEWKLPTLNSTKHRDFRAYYDTICIDIISKYYAKDIARFGYTFE